jgi:MFS family permease
MLTFSPLVGWIYDRTRSRAMRPVAMSVMALGLFLMFLLGNRLSFWGFYALVILRGLGSGIFLTPNNTAILNSLPAQWRGFATGSFETTRQMGHTFGVAVASLVFALTVPLVGTVSQDYVDGFRNTAMVMATLTVGGAILSAFAGKTPPRRR